MTESPSVIDRLNAALDGRYRVERRLGEGGMATVYLAEDLRHHRPVAIKVLKAELAAVLGVERFLAEIETTAQLQHPGILPLFDSGEAEGTVFFVMPYVDDETLRERLDHERQLPVDDAVRIAAEVAGALDYAHRQGVVHRDIKPANILMREGRPIVADFGIALAASRSGGNERLTETGMSLGTPFYMSPEQATGAAAIGQATDVYALACVLYEMLVGEPPYTGATPQAVLGKIITGQVDPPSVARATVPPNVDAALTRALEKIPADRFRSAGEFAAALRDPGFRYGEGAGGGAGAGDAGPGPWRAGALVAGAVAVVALGALALGGGGGAEPQLVTRVAMVPYSPAMPRPIGTFTALAPDGSSMVYAVADDPAAPPNDLSWSLVLKTRDQIEPALLGGTENGQHPTYSPDGTSIVYASGGEVRRRPVGVGVHQTLASGVAPGAASMVALDWMDDGTILYELPGSTLMRVSENGGTPDTVAVFGPAGLGFTQFSYVAGLPGSRGALFSVCPELCATSVSIGVYDFETDSAHVLLNDVVRGWYVPTGHLVYVTRTGAVFAAPFDLETLEIVGDGLPLFDGISITSTSPQMVVGSDGTVVFARGAQAGSANSERRVVVLDRNGGDVTPGPVLNGLIRNVALSPSDDRLAVSMIDPSTNIPQLFVKELWDGPLTRLTTDTGFTRRPVWSEDGNSITYITNEPGNYWARRVATDGSSLERFDAILARGGDGVFEVAYVPGGEGLIFREGSANVGAADLGYLDLQSGVVEEDYLRTTFNERGIMISPDGRWLAYTSDEGGATDEVYVRPLRGGGSRVPISNGGGTDAVWAHDGEEIFFIDGGGFLAAARVETDPEFRVVGRDRLFDAAAYYSWSAEWRRFDVFSDDERFVMLAWDLAEGPLPGRPALDYVLIENFLEELRALDGG